MRARRIASRDARSRPADVSRARSPLPDTPQLKDTIEYQKKTRKCYCCFIVRGRRALYVVRDVSLNSLPAPTQFILIIVVVATVAGLGAVFGKKG